MGGLRGGSAQPARAARRVSISAPEGAPITTSRSPEASWNTHAGWPETPKEEKIEPSGSRTLVKVRP